MSKINRLRKSIKQDGIIKTVVKIINKIKTKIASTIMKYKNNKKDVFSEINFNSFKRVIIFENQFGWNKIMKQRPQQIANAVDTKTLFIYGTTYHEIGDMEGIKKINNNLYLVDLVIHKTKLISKLQKIKNKFLMIYSTDYIPVNVLKPYLDSKFRVIYEYVDGIDEKLCGKETAKLLRKRHELIINNYNPYIIATATKLYNDVKKTNENSRVALITNGADYEHFEKCPLEIPEDIKNIKEKDSIIIGYYGALASWFDYELIKKLAKSNSEYEIVLIGLDYDKTLETSDILKLDNVHYLGKKEYEELPQYLHSFDICMIPFLINEITMSTSPVKAFEYMAAKKPIVTTNLPECKKYKSILIGKNHSDFIEKIKEATKKINDKGYMAILAKEAEENKWSNKFNDLIKFISDGE